MTIIYDSKLHQKVEFSPTNPGAIGIYLCGPTVQGSPHIGHMRVAVAFDIIRRYFEATGYDVNLVRNVTDIDDKILKKAVAENVSWKEIAAKYDREFEDAYSMLRVLAPTHTPHATAEIPSQTALIDKLLSDGHAYITETGDIYFDVASFSDYGALTNQGTGTSSAQAIDVETELAGDSVKKDPRDFALWKVSDIDQISGNDETASWGYVPAKTTCLSHENGNPSHSGENETLRGRPGWHLECSAMSNTYLTDGFDIHGGGIDLRFPHHENELAQSSAAGYVTPKYWMHSSWVTQKGEKMSKSLGNTFSISEIVKIPLPPAAVEQGVKPEIALRFALGSSHYRAQIEFDDTTFVEAANTLAKFYKALSSEANEASDVPENTQNFDNFIKALSLDFNVALAISHMHKAAKQKDLNGLQKMLELLGVQP